MKAAILGYGKSGQVAEKLLIKQGYNDITIFDDKIAGCKPLSEFVDGYDIVSVSPGVNMDKLLIKPRNITSEIELAFNAMSESARIIAITGTNGKSTVTHITAQIINNAGFKAVACGNIGYPFGEAVLDETVQVFVVELSSFQLDLLNNFSADAACITNVTEDHMDRYKDMKEYYSSKLKMLNFVLLDGIFVSNEDVHIMNVAMRYQFATRYVDDNLKAFPRLNGNIMEFDDFFVDISNYKLFGYHNLLNLSYALTLCSLLLNLQGDATAYIKGLTPMAHRTEHVGLFKGIDWIDDSKATNVDSVLVALRSIKAPSYLLLGGRDKHSDYQPLVNLINSNVSTVCYFGEAATLIHKQISNLVHVNQELFETLEEAVIYCSNEAKSGATVILSPACTSFDEFKSFEHRGNMFKEYIMKYTK